MLLTYLPQLLTTDTYVLIIKDIVISIHLTTRLSKCMYSLKNMVFVLNCMLYFNVSVFFLKVISMFLLFIEFFKRHV